MVGAIVPGERGVGAPEPRAAAPAAPAPTTRAWSCSSPGEGKAITEYDTGAVDVSVRFWKQSEGPDSARTVSYTIYVV